MDEEQEEKRGNDEEQEEKRGKVKKLQLHNGGLHCFWRRAEN